MQQDRYTLDFNLDDETAATSLRRGAAIAGAEGRCVWSPNEKLAIIT